MIEKNPTILERLFTALLGVVYIIPLGWIVLTAFKSDQQARSGPNDLLFAPTLSTLQEILGAASSSILASLQISLSVTLIVIVISVPAAYAIARKITPRWSQIAAVVLGVFLILQMMPQPMAIIPLYGILAQWGLVNSIFGLILADVAFFTPFAILLLRPFLLTIPNEVFEAAEIDGASQFRTFRSIVFPLVTNGIATVASIIFITTWGEFIYATTLITNSNDLPVSGLLAQQISLYSVSWNKMMALALLTSIPLLIVFLIAKRRLVAGLSVGAVK